MRLKIIVVAEDHQHGVKSTRDGTIDVPGHMLSEGRVDVRDRVRQLAEWGVTEAGRVIMEGIQGQQGHHQQPSNPLYMPNAPQPGQEYGGWQPGQGGAAPPPYIGEGAPPPGTPAPLDSRRMPRNEQQMVQLSAPGIIRAVQEDKRKGANFVVGQQNQPVKLNMHVGWGPHRSR